MESLPKQLKKREITCNHINPKDDNNPFECCVICNQQTQYRFKTHIETRGCYVEGCGQLCPPCYLACYNTSTVNTFEDYLFE